MKERKHLFSYVLMRLIQDIPNDKYTVGKPFGHREEDVSKVVCRGMLGLFFHDILFLCLLGTLSAESVIKAA